MSQNEYLRGQADVAHLDPLAVVALRSFLDLCSDRPSETQKATFSRAGALHLSLLSSILCTGAKLRFSFVRTGGGRSRSESYKLEIFRTTASKVSLWKGCDVHCGA